MAIPHFNRRIFKRAAIGLLILFAGYVVTVGAVPSIFRLTSDGERLQWLARSPRVMTLLEAYEWPTRCVPVLNLACEFSASCWYELLDPPDTTA
jgi:hypothetical protein